KKSTAARFHGVLLPILKGDERTASFSYSPFAPPYKWHATSRSSTFASAGAWREQASIACGQRGWKWQPGGGRSGDGTSPVSTISSRRSSGLDGSAAENSAADEAGGRACGASRAHRLLV